ncbi:MAG: glutathione S-transferase family protein [Betaproteobacteria bacterium]|nr:glutathione S-transferase family protein [Betaproteobacteria bacterium]MDH3438054.1 glutathione S-transferase family protein [Betaproteobacteria bacterium]
MKLYGSPNSPYARKLRVLIKEKNLPVEFVIEDPWPEDSPIISRNPFSKVPVLEVGPDNYLFESIFIAHYLDNLDGKPLQPNDAEGYWHAQWWQALGNGMIDSVIGRVLETRRPPDKQWPEKMAREEKRVLRAIDVGERAFRENRFIVGGAFTMADLVMGVALQYVDFRYPHDWRAPHPELARWHAGITSRKSFEETLPPGFVKPT